MTENLDQRVSLFGELKAESFYARTDAEALAKAQAHIADGGFIPTAPQMVRDRINQEPSDMVWMKTYMTLTEEHQGVAGGKDGLLVIHGQTGILTPEALAYAVNERARVQSQYDAAIEAEQDYDRRKDLRIAKFAELESLTYAGGLRIGDGAIDQIMADPQLKTIPIEQYLTMGTVPYRHAILFEIAALDEKPYKGRPVEMIPELASIAKKNDTVEKKETHYGIKVNGQVYVPELIQSLEQAARDPLFIARAGGRDNAEGILQRLDGTGHKRVGNWHRLRDYKPTHTIGYRLQVGDQGLSHGFCPHYIGTDARVIAIRMTPEIEAVARRTYFDIGTAHGNGNGNGKRKTPPEGMPALLMPKPQRPAAPEELRGRSETIGPGEIEEILQAKPAIPPPRQRRATAGTAVPPPPPRGNGTKV